MIHDFPHENSQLFQDFWRIANIHTRTETPWDPTIDGKENLKNGLRA